MRSGLDNESGPEKGSGSLPRTAEVRVGPVFWGKVTGERIWNFRRAVMVKREDRSRERDTYADGFFDSPWTDIQDRDNGYTAYIDRAKFEALKDRYYELAGWDLKTGRPTRATLEELDMKDVADELDATGKLP
jgi:hypothetical protein